MNAWDYRLIAEYYLLRDRRLKLERILDGDTPECFEPKTPYEILRSQWHHMINYEKILEHRLDLECPGWRV